MTELSMDDRDVIICALLNKLGGVTSLRPQEFQLGDVSTRVTRLPTGTIHLELVATPVPTGPNPEQQSTADSDAPTHPGG